MTSDSDRRRRAAGRDAADWYVELDANPSDRERESALVEWLERSTEHEAAFERCEAAVMLARELAGRAGVAAESDRTTRSSNGPRPEGARGGLRRVSDVLGHWLGRLARSPLRPLGHPAVAWSVAAVAVIWAAVASVERDAPSVSEAGPRTAAARSGAGRAAPPAVKSSDVGIAARGDDDGTVDGALVALAGDGTGLADASAAFDAAASVTSLTGTSFVNPVGVLPGEIVVDVHSVAVLPFDGVNDVGEPAPSAREAEASAAERIAMLLHDDVVRQLASIPGVYVVDRSTSAVYADGRFDPGEIAAFLGVRGVVAADVAVDGRTVRVTLRMTDAVNDGRRTEATFERPLGELPAVRTAIVSNIAETLASAAF